jgi:hypothetical protein
MACHPLSCPYDPSVSPCLQFEGREYVVTTRTGSLQAGVAFADITPPVGIALVGFAGRGSSIGIHDPLRATALVLTDGTSWAALVACDLLGLSAEVVADIRQEISRRCDIAPDHITISCTYTHYGPDTYRDMSSDDVGAYRACLKYKIAGVVFEASQSVRPARLGIC